MHAEPAMSPSQTKRQINGQTFIYYTKFKQANVMRIPKNVIVFVFVRMDMCISTVNVLIVCNVFSLHTVAFVSFIFYTYLKCVCMCVCAFFFLFFFIFL